jgi:hypothetical protein
MAHYTAVEHCCQQNNRMIKSLRYVDSDTRHSDARNGLYIDVKAVFLISVTANRLGHNYNYQDLFRVLNEQ